MMNTKKNENESETAGVNTPEAAVLAGLSNIYKLTCVSCTLGFAWLGAAFAAYYFAFSTTDGTFSQSLATNALASLVMIPIAFLLLKPPLRVGVHELAIILVGTGLLVTAAVVGGGLQDFLLNLGCGLWFLAIVDSYIKASLSSFLKRIEKEATEPITPVL